MTFSDPNTYRGWIELVIAIVTAAGLFWKGVDLLNKRQERRIIEVVKQATQPIQPDANGGKSLADLHEKFDGLHADLKELKDSHDSHIKLLH